MNIVVFIPARSGSKSILNKNIRELDKLPLLAWSINTGRDCKLRTIVNSDSPEYLEIARRYGAETMLRPAELALDKTSMYDLLRVEVKKINPKPDIIVLLQPTSPFRRRLDVEAALHRFVDRDYDSLISVSRVPAKYHPEEVLIEVLPGVVLMASGAEVKNRKTRRQDYVNAYYPNGQFYIFKADNLDRGSIYGDRVSVFEQEDAGVNINTQEDWDEATRLCAHK